MKYCPYCGAGLDADMRFCPNCGKPFEGGKANPHIASKRNLQEEPAADVPVQPPVIEAAPKKKSRGGLIAVIAILAVLVIVGVLFASGAFAPKEEPAPTEEPVIPFVDDTEAIAQASQSVVMLTCYDKDGEPYATGSGFAIFDDGVIVTNYHVIEQEVYRIKAQTESGGSFECPTVLAYDAEKDIAILKADRETGLTLLPPGSSKDLQKGAKVVAIGSPLGLLNSVSTGVFSGYITDNAGSMLQFTAAISHGSSGGALFNDAGEVIGITFASLTEGQSLNLAVPIDDVKALYDYAGSSQQMSIEEFYNSFDHTPPIPIYTVDELLAHSKELDQQEVIVDGYVSAITEMLGFDFSEKKNVDTYWLYLVDAPQKVTNINVYNTMSADWNKIIMQAERNEVLILGAFGCGAFKNPPEVVAKVFLQITAEYCRHFETIEYAVFHTDRETENYKAFKRAFSK